MHDQTFVMIVDTLNITIMLIYLTKAIQLTQHTRKLKGLGPPDRMVIWASLDSSSDLPSSDDSQLTGKSTMTVDVFSDWKKADFYLPEGATKNA